jgi:GDP-L-fucose synthase
MNKKIKDTLINIGTGKEMKIKEYAKFIIKKLNLSVKIKFRSSKPDGMKRKVLDISRAKKYGWFSKTSLDDGFDQTYQEFLKKMNRK